jgi:hypothetical protein
MSDEEFKHPALDAVHRAIEAIRIAEELRKEALSDLETTILNLGSMVEDDQAIRSRVVWHLYWRTEKVQQAWIKKGFGLKESDLKAITSQSWVHLTCPTCQRKHAVQVPSKLELSWAQKRWWHDQHATCPECQAKKKAQEDAERQARALVQEKRFHELHTMPYYDYLQTPEWNERRTLLLKKARYHCQVCNAHGVRLNVHHKTYERRGYEDEKDLIVLCQDCHAIFHENGKLAEEDEEEL